MTSFAERPRFIVLDGVDGCGKSTQAALLTETLRARGRDPLHLREPGSSAAGERIRAVLLDRELEIHPATETLLFAAARCQTLHELVEPAMARGQDVVCERFHASTFAYQAVAGELNESAVLALLDEWASTPLPDLEIVLTLDVQAAAKRRGRASDRIEDKGVEFQARVAAGYSRYVELVGRAVAVDASAPADEVHQSVLQAIDTALDREPQT